jgi:hypothetical protein
MSARQPSEVNDELISKQEQLVNDLTALYTKQGSPKDFKKVWKYESLLNWTKKFIEVVKAAKDAENV